MFFALVANAFLLLSSCGMADAWRDSQDIKTKFDSIDNYLDSVDATTQEKLGSVQHRIDSIDAKTTVSKVILVQVSSDQKVYVDGYLTEVEAFFKTIENKIETSEIPTNEFLIQLVVHYQSKMSIITDIKQDLRDLGLENNLECFVDRTD